MQMREFDNDVALAAVAAGRLPVAGIHLPLSMNAAAGADATAAAAVAEAPL